MSIRLKLTLLYSTILSITLLIFGVVLYSIQANDTLYSLKQDIINTSTHLQIPVNNANRNVQPNSSDGQAALPPKRFDEFPADSQFRDIREREIVRILDSEFALFASPFGSIEDSIPLSENGKTALQSGNVWWEQASVNDELMLIYSRPVTAQGGLQYYVQVARSLTERNRTLQSLRNTLLLAGVVMVVIAFGIGWTIAGYSLRPIKRITQTAKLIGDQRDFTRRVTHQGPKDEVGQLASTFNEMLSRLETAHNKVEQALDQQRNFVADVSHELRTPLTTLRGNLALMNKKAAIPEDEQQDILDDMVSESDRMIRLVNDLLNLAHADARQNPEKYVLNISPVLEESVREAKYLDRKRKITSSISPGLVMMGNEDILKQIMLILIDNAIKHSSGEISIVARKDQANINIDVIDRGKGIPASEQKLVFERFFRGKGESREDGFGLGPPIAQTLTEKIGGKISIDSEVGKGSTFSLIFPFHGEDI